MRSLYSGRIRHIDGTGIPNAVTLDELDTQHQIGWIEFHPEDFCHRCGNRNMDWYAPDDLWADVMGDEEAAWQWHHIICVPCFIEIATDTLVIGSRSWSLTRDPWTGLVLVQLQEAGTMTRDARLHLDTVEPITDYGTVKPCVCCGTADVEIPDTDGDNWCRKCWAVAVATTTIRPASIQLDDTGDDLTITYTVDLDGLAPNPALEARDLLDQAIDETCDNYYGLPEHSSSEIFELIVKARRLLDPDWDDAADLPDCECGHPATDHWLKLGPCEARSGPRNLDYCTRYRPDTP